MLMTGLIYPGVVTGLAGLLFPKQADGSLLARDGKTVGSARIGQSFALPYYFHPRPSAAGSGYVGDSSSGTNKGPTDRKLADTLIAQAVDSAVKNDGAVKGRIPADMVTSSGSGLDPDISPANADLQVARVAAARNASPAAVRALVAAHTRSIPRFRGLAPLPPTQRSATSLTHPRCVGSVSPPFQSEVNHVTPSPRQCPGAGVRPPFGANVGAGHRLGKEGSSGRHIRAASRDPDQVGSLCVR
jgi:K+-transporting ATPase ATPase C chain